jgi:hypothetical protein
MRYLRLCSESVVGGLNASIQRLPDYRDPVKPGAGMAALGAAPKHRAKVFPD